MSNVSGPFKILASAAILSALAADAQPGNDAFANRDPILHTNISGTLSNATYETGEPFIPGISSGQTAWWSWGAPSNGSLALTLTASNFNPLVTVYTGDALTNLTLVASNNYLMCYSDGTCGCHWRVREGTSFHVAKGESYHICIDSAVITDASRSFSLPQGIVTSFLTNTFAGGDFHMAVQFTPAPTNDDFEQPTKLVGERGHILASNKGATRQAGEPDQIGNPGGSSVWYIWTAPASGRLTLSTNEIAPYAPPSWTNESGGWVQIGFPPDILSCGDEIDQNPPPPFYPVFAAYTGNSLISAVPANCLSMGLAAYPHAVQFDVTRGQTYRIAFDGNMGTTAETPLYYALTRPARNDSFAGRIKIHGTALTATGYNAGATRERGETPVPGSVGKSVWWSWIAPTTGTVSIDFSQSDYSFPVGVFTGTSVSNLALVTSGLGNASFNAVQGRTYQIAVNDTNGLTGAIQFSLRAPIVQLPEVQPPSYSHGLTTMSYGASPRQVALLQVSTDNEHWQNVAMTRASGNKVVFAVKTRPAAFYRAVVVDFF